MIRTWMFEACFVALCLAAVLFFTGGYHNPIEWVGSCAVLLTFCHAQVADRLAEKAAKHEALGQETVECHRWAQRYWVFKESLWLVYFLFLHAYSALVGVGVFLAYPIWRAWWRSRREIPQEQPELGDIHLVSVGQHVVEVHVEVDGEWRVAIREHHDCSGCSISHFVCTDGPKPRAWPKAFKESLDE